MLCLDTVDDLLLILGHLGELASVAAPHVFTAGTQPHRLVLEVPLLVVAQVPTVEIVQTPPIPVTLFRAREIAQPQARFRPPHVILGAVDSFEHDRLVELFADDPLPQDVVLPQAPPGLRAVLVSGLGVAHAPIADGLQLAKVAHEDDGDAAEPMRMWILGALTEVAPLRLLQAVIIILV